MATCLLAQRPGHGSGYVAVERAALRGGAVVHNGLRPRKKIGRPPSHWPWLRPRKRIRCLPYQVPALSLALAALDPFFVAVFVWAYTGIAARQADLPGVAATAAWGAGVLALLTLVVALLAWRRRAEGRRLGQERLPGAADDGGGVLPLHGAA